MTPRGRFAPSPTGPLHFGSLVAAVGSFLDARSRGGEWLVRIEDVDVPRAAPGAADAILRDLERLGLHWDGGVVHQSDRVGAYRDALAALLDADRAFPCACSRRDLVGGVYPGTCRAGLAPGRRARSVRARVAGARVAFRDALQGERTQDLDAEVGDFVVRRADGLHAYHLAVVVDDAAQGVTSIVRGADLLESTPRQIHLQRALSLPTPEYAHLPVAVDAAGRKLSKQTGAAPIAGRDAAALVAEALEFLGHAPPPALRGEGLAALWSWARGEWRRARVPRVAAIRHPDADPGARAG